MKNTHSDGACGNINKNTTIYLTTEEEWRQAAPPYHDIGYIKRILSSPEETYIYPKELRNKGCVKPFQQGHMELENGLISYYENPSTSSVRQIKLRVVPVKFRQVVMSA